MVLTTFAIALIQSSAADDRPPEVGPDAPIIAAADAQADFDFMRKALEEAHPGLYRYSTKTEMDQWFTAQRAKLGHSLAKPEYFEVMAETLTRIRCGHTSLNPDDERGKEFGNARLFPLQVLLEGRRVMVKLNDTPDDRTIRPGMEVLEINGQPMPDVLNRFWKIETADGDVETSKRIHIQRGFAMYYWFLIGPANEFTVLAKDAAGVTVKAKLAGVTRDQLGRSENPVNTAMQAGLAKSEWPGGNLSLRFLRDPEIAAIRIRSFAGDDFPHWIEDTFKTLRDRRTTTLIIDLRGNGGGADVFGAMLVSYLTDKPFRYFDHIDAKTIEPSFKAQADWSSERTSQLRKEVTPNPAGGYFVKHAGIAEQTPGKYPFLGKVLVLIDGGVFSTAADFCAITHHLHRATFIGEETGGGYYGNNSGAVAHVTLPRSGFRLRLPLYAYWNAVSGDGGERHGTLPDYVVETKTENLLRGVDRQLEIALAIASTGRQKPGL